MSIDSFSNNLTKAFGADKKQFNMFFEKMMDGFAYHRIVVDKDGKPIDYVFLEVNNAFEKMTGLKREEVIGKKVTEVIKGIEKDPADWIGRYGKVALTCEPAQFENYAKALGKWYSVSAYCPQRGYFAAVFEDITGRKKNEESLRQSEEEARQRAEELQKLMDIIPAAVWLSRDPECKIIVGNEAANSFYEAGGGENVSAGPASGKEQDTTRRFFHNGKELSPQELPMQKAAAENVEIKNSELEVLVPSGKKITLLGNAKPLLDSHGKVRGCLGAFVDITERKEYEQMLLANEDMLKRSQAIAHLGSWELDLKENKLTWSDEVYRIFGLKPQEFGASYEAFLAAVHPEDRKAVDMAYSNSVSEGKDGYEIEHRVLRKDNDEVRVVHEKCTHFRDLSGKIIKSMGMVHDVTDRRRAEDQIISAKEDWERTFDAVPDFIAILDTNYHIIRVNKSMAKQLGVNPKESMGLICYECIHGLKGPPAFCPHAELLKDGKQHTVEVHEPRLGGDFIVSATPLRDKTGNLIGSVHVARNITARKKAEEALRASEQRWATTLSSIGDAVVATDVNGSVTFMNSVAEKLTGWTLQEAKDQPVRQIFNIINQVTRKEVESPVVKVLADGLTVGLANHTLLIRKDGTEVPIDDSGAPILSETGEIIGVVLVFRDITERRKTEDALQRQAALIDLSPDAIIVRKVDGTITFWSRGAEKLYGWSKAEAVGKRTHELLRTEFPQSFEDIFVELKTKYRWSGEVVQHTKDGRAVTMQSWWLAERTEHGEVTSILESNVDLTERKKAEREIARLATFPTLNPNPIIEVDLNGEITYANPATKLLFPDLEKEGLKHTFFSSWKIVKHAFADKSINAYETEVEINGHWYHQQFYRLPQTEQIRIYLTDIDELKQTELARAKAQAKLEENALVLEEYASQMEELAEQRAKQLQSAERLAAIGQTAGMVGHDIRNPLQAITSDIYIIAQEVKDLQDGERKGAILESIESVNQNLTYINKIVSDLQDYTRPLKPNLQESDLSELVEGILLTINIPKEIEVQTQIHPEAQPIVTDAAYMRRILTNLITNAIQAMTNGGNLTIAATKKKNAVALTIQDTGIGISQDVRAKMFTPLFTTKSKGQGLGLAVVKRLVDALGGTIDFESQPNSGTKFILHFPLSTDGKSAA